MTNHHYRSLLPVDEAFGGSDVVLEGRERVLNRDDVITVIQQKRDEAFEAARIRKGAVHEHDRRLGG
jgi:hypothetical protein